MGLGYCANQKIYKKTVFSMDALTDVVTCSHI